MSQGLLSPAPNTGQDEHNPCNTTGGGVNKGVAVNLQTR